MRGFCSRMRTLGRGFPTSDLLPHPHCALFSVALEARVGAIGLAKALRHFGEIRRDQLERRSAVADRVLVNLGNGREVGRSGGPDFGRGHGGEIIFADRKRKAPAARPGLQFAI